MLKQAVIANDQKVLLIVWTVGNLMLFQIFNQRLSCDSASMYRNDGNEET